MANIKKTPAGEKLLASLKEKNIKELVLGKTFLQKRTQSLLGRGKTAFDLSPSIADARQPLDTLDVKNVKK